jgi:hypothetical protein
MVPSRPHVEDAAVSGLDGLSMGVQDPLYVPNPLVQMRKRLPTVAIAR